MKKFAATLAAALVALVSLAGLAPSAQAYPQPFLTLDASQTTVVSGHSFQLIAHATVKCDVLTINWNGQTFHRSGSSFSQKFTAPFVTTTTIIQATATCSFSSAAGTAGNSIVATQLMTNTAHKDVTVVPVKSKGSGHGSGGGNLPNTGGPSIGWLIAGILALLAGAAAMFAGRRRDSGVASH